MAKYKNILQIINLPSSARNFIGGQFSFMRNHGYNVHLICSPDDQIYSFAREKQINYQAIQLARTLSIWKDIKAFFSICKFIKDNDIDTVIAHQAKARLLGTLAAFCMRVPNRVIFAHGIIFETMTGIKRQVMIWMDRFVASMAHKTVCVSKSVAQVRQRYNIEKASRQFFLGAGTCNGIDTVNTFNPSRLDLDEQYRLKSQLGIQDNDFIVGFCGRLVRDKGVKELVEGFETLMKSYDNVKLMIIGRVEIRDCISQELVYNINNNASIIHIDNIEHSDIYKYFSLFSVVVLPSYREGFGMVTIECAAMNVPAIVSKSTGCIDSIIEEETGLYCEITPTSIAEQIEFFIKNPEKRMKMGSNARKTAMNLYDSSVIWPYVIDVIEA